MTCWWGISETGKSWPTTSTMMARFTFEGEMRGTDHKPLRDGFLWALWFGNGANGSDPNTLYITTGGANQNTDGLFAALSPEPAD